MSINDLKSIDTIIHFNQHAGYYQPIKDWINEQEERDWIMLKDWASPLERELAIENNSVWTIQWYPRTPVSFYVVAASTFAAALETALKIQDDESK